MLFFSLLTSFNAESCNELCFLFLFLTFTFVTRVPSHVHIAHWDKSSWSLSLPLAKVPYDATEICLQSCEHKQIISDRNIGAPQVPRSRNRTFITNRHDFSLAQKLLAGKNAPKPVPTDGKGDVRPQNQETYEDPASRRLCDKYRELHLILRFVIGLQGLQKVRCHLV